MIWLNVSKKRESIKQILVVHPKRPNKIKLEDGIAILLYLFLAEVIDIFHGIWNINTLNFQHCNNSSQAKEFSFTVNFIINTLITKINQKNKQTIKGNYVSVRIG